MKKVYFIKGAKWHDKVYGNTYCNAHVYDGEGNDLGYIGFQYGYGNSYLFGAKTLIAKANGLHGGCALPTRDYKIIDLGAEYITKKRLKENSF